MQSDAEQPEWGQPDVEQPDMEQPNLEQPTLEQPDISITSNRAVQINHVTTQPQVTSQSRYSQSATGILLVERL